MMEIPNITGAKLTIPSELADAPLPVELSAFTAKYQRK